MSDAAPASMPPPASSATAPLALLLALRVGDWPHASAGAAFGAVLDHLCQGQEATATEAASTSSGNGDQGSLRRSVLRFRFEADRVRALLARLAMHAVVSAVTGAPLPSLRFARSAYGKPFLQSPSAWRTRLAFNLSHHGDFVVLGVEALLSSPDSVSSSRRLPLLGVDVTTIELPRGCATVDSYLCCMQECFTPAEWELIRDPRAHELDTHWHAPHTPEALDPSSSSNTAQSCGWCALARFAWLWSLKESVIKAIGMGLSFQLQHIEFRLRQADQALLSPVDVHFLGSPSFADDAVESSASSSSSGVLSRPPDLADVDDLVRDVRWSFQSALLDDRRHIVTRCRGVKHGAGERTEESQESVQEDAASLSSPHASGAEVDPSASLHSLSHASQLAQLGTRIDLPSASSSAGDSEQTEEQLPVRLLHYTQLLPPELLAQINQPR